KMFIEANPQFKSVNLYDSNLKKVYQENEKKEPRVDNGREKTAAKEDQKQSAVEEPDEDLIGQKKQPKKKFKV
ncbi:MAG TPA: hypothetical protein VFW11_05780, partial [Cyclobacteriaceae bacterium]|nr:hypothetical protein [Cyclobacteriaceae bacterium]